MTVAEALRLGERQLAEAGIDTPRVDAELLLAHVLGVSRTAVYAQDDIEVPGTYEVLLGRRSSASRSRTCSASGVSAGSC